MDAAKKIHSCPQRPDAVSKTDTLKGLWNTFVSYADNKDVVELCSRSRKVNTLVVPKVVNDSVAAFEKSAKNYERSVRKLVKTIVHARDPLFGGQGKEETMGLPS